jgi:hypothetical protein
MGDWSKYGEWKKMVYSMNRCNREEMVHSVKAWLIEKNIWCGDMDIRITGTTQWAWQKNFRINFKIEGLKGEFRVMSDELTELDP